MKTLPRYWFLVPATVLLTLVLGINSGYAYDEGRPILVAVPDAFPYPDAQAVIIRDDHRDLIVLRSGATAETLAVSLRLLRNLREQNPTPAQGEIIPVAGMALTVPLAADRRGPAEEALRRLADKPKTQIGNLGPGRWINLGSR